MNVSPGAVLFVTTLARFVSPGADPASRTYVVTGSPLVGGDQASVTVLPATVALRPVGAFGNAPDVAATSFEGRPVPMEFRPRTLR